MAISNMVAPESLGVTPTVSNYFKGLQSFPDAGLQAPNSPLTMFMPQSSGSGGSGFGSFLGSMGSSLLSGGLGAAGSLLSGFMNNMFAMRAQKRQFKYNTQLMNMQNALQRDMIEDDALLKLQGYKKAGLSTASLGGSFGNAASVPSQSVGASQGSMPDMRLGDIFNAARQVKLQEEALMSEINLNNANAESARANARSNIANAGITERYGSQEAERRIKQADENIRFLAATTDTERAKVQSIFKGMELTDAQIRQIDTLLGIEIKKLGPLLRNFAANTAQAYGNANYMNSQANRSNALLPYDVQQAGKNLVKTDTEIKKMESETGLNEQNILYLAELKKKASVEKDFILQRQYQLEFDNAVRDKLGKDFFVDKAKMEKMNLRLDNIGKGIDDASKFTNFVGGVFSGSSWGL